jgi:hypothetical protein
MRLNKLPPRLHVVAHSIRRLEQCLKASSREVGVVGESLADAEATHDDERSLIDDASAGCIATFISVPRSLPLCIAEREQASLGSHSLTQLIHIAAIGTAGGGVAAFEHDGFRCYADKSGLFQPIVGLLSGRVPLIRIIPKRNQPYGIKKNGVHG